MINLLSKSPETFEKFTNKLDMILTEMRYQRADLSTIKRQLHTLNNNFALQKQVDEYFEEGADTIPGLKDTRTSPQTDLEDK